MTKASPWSYLFTESLSDADRDIAHLIERQRRQNTESINLVASESYCPRATLDVEIQRRMKELALSHPIPFGS